VKRGDRFGAYQDEPIRRRLFIEITRVAKDGTWADIRVCNCFVMWTKRQKLDARGMPPASEPMAWDQTHLDQQARLWDVP